MTIKKFIDMSNEARGYMRVGTTFEKDGTAYVVREASAGTCKGCAFYSINEEGAPECRGLDFLCDEGCREDEKNVVFQTIGKREQC